MRLNISALLFLHIKNFTYNLFLKFLLLISFLEIGYAQNSSRVFGSVSEKGNREILIGVVFSVEGQQIKNHRIGGVTNAFGYYSIEVADTGIIGVRFSLLGYRDTLIVIHLNKNREQRLDVQMEQQSINVDEVVVYGIRPLQKIQMSIMPPFQMNIGVNKTLPSIGGETDISKLLQLLPGVATGQEGSNALYVRGGSGDQNLLLLDGATVYNPDHLFGFLSVFNSDAIQSVSLLKGGFPAEYGGRLSSIYSINMKEGAKDRLRVSAGISLLSSKLLVEGPLNFYSDETQQENNAPGSFMISARRTYIDPVLSLMNKSSSTDINASTFSFYFYDFNAKANYELSQDDRLFFSAYFGKDVLNFSQENVFDDSSGPGTVKDINLNLDWGNYAYHFRYNRIWSSQLFSNLSAVFSRYQFNSNIDLPTITSKKNPVVSDVTIRTTWDWLIGRMFSLRFGGEMTQHHFETVAGINELSVDEQVLLDANEFVGFISNDWSLSERWSMTLGVRGEYFSKGNYTRLEPRYNISFMLNEASSIKASYTQINQFVHLLSASSFASPSDVWYPSTDFLKPQTSDQISVGWLQYLSGLSETYEYEFSVDGFYKTYDNLSMFRQSFVSAQTDQLRNDLIFGKGISYGFEMMVRKEAGTISGFISYSYSHSERTFSQKNGGDSFTPRFDKPHMFNTFLTYKVSDQWTVSSTFVFTSGQPVTVPRQKYFISGPSGEYDGNPSIYVPIDYGKIYSYRLPIYNRMDVSAAYSFKGWSGEWELNLSIYNLYNYPNPLFIDFNDPSSETSASKSSIGLLPSIGISAKF